MSVSGRLDPTLSADETRHILTKKAEKMPGQTVELEDLVNTEDSVGRSLEEGCHHLLGDCGQFD
jgi:hypothetical protein